ncbi:Ubiquitin carboxyl-terminal hydrolase-related protein [Abeliophyllum distichum]|uniref:Ubiquitin carboxyl-terminal hydrolase-related protein n=1 Tax=Abeliophyllum distichum TaxID=126358 RepID=A0ABD1PN08_9LAMI
MGPKKRNIAPHSKSSQPLSEAAASPTTAAVDGGEKTESPNLESSSNATPSSLVTLEDEYKRALTALRRGNYTKALKLMKKLCSKHENFGFIHYVMGVIFVKVASDFNDPNAKQRHLKNAIESAKKSVTLSPNSIEFSHYYANLLFDTANVATDYVKVLQECKRALEIKKPTDPAKESVQESYEKISSAEARVAHVQNQLRTLMENSFHESVLIRKNRAKEEKFVSIAKESRLVPGRRPNEIKTPEERRKEIEVRVTAARLLQHKPESPQSSNIDSHKGLDSGSGMGKRVGERTKSGNVRRKKSSVEIRDRVRSYWNSMDLDWKKEFLRVRIADLKEGLVNEVLDEALSFGKENKVWKFWWCYCCNEKFVVADTHRQHVIQKHMGTLEPEYQSIMPHRVEDEWAEMLLNCPWKPLDLNAAIRMLEDDSKCSNQESNFDESNPRNDEDDSSPGKEKLGDENQGRKKSFLYKSWPSTNDSKCACLLERIHAKFQLLIQHNCLASSHLSKVKLNVVQVLKRLPECSQLLNSDVDQTPQCICFLGSLDLEKILIYLQEIERELFLSEKKNFVGDSISGAQIVDTMEKISFTPDDLVLELDERFLSCKLNSSLSDDAGRLSGEVLLSWTCAREEKVQQGIEIVQLHEKEFYDLQRLCARKNKNLNYEKALHAIDSLCWEESSKRDNVVNYVPQSYGSVLRKRQEELIGSDNRLELAALENVLKDAESGEDDDLNSMDSIIHGMWRQRNNLSFELSRVDARILQVVNWMQQLEVKLDSASVYDFRSILVPLMKSYLQAHLEDLAEKDAIKKSDAAREAFLAELAFDSRHMHERMKDKKSKEKTKNKDSKATAGIHDQTSEEIAQDGDDPDAAIALRQREEEYKHRIELELEEILKYVRQIQNEAIQKHLAKLPMSSEKENDEVGQLRSKHTPDGDEALPPLKLPKMGDLDFSSNKVIADGVNIKDICGPGLKNKVGEYNCFLNVIIQSLWHLRRFRDEFLRRSSGHVHFGNPCVTCALYDIFISLSTPNTDTRREAVDPTSLRVALSNLYPDSNFFQEGQMNDASEVLGVILDSLHQSFPCVPVIRVGTLDCKDLSCIAHSLFGMDISERMNCDSCGVESRNLKYKSFYHNINASALRTLKVRYPENSFDELLNLVEMNHQLACDPEAGGCGKLNCIHHVLLAQPHVFVTVLGWQNICESIDDIKETLAALSTEIDISVLYHGLDPKSIHSLVSMVCFYWRHYRCFAYKHEHEQWIMYDDETVKEIGGWNDVLTLCETQHMQPQVLFFEAVS